MQKSNLKRIPLVFGRILLTSGASLILGLLSFGGMYALAPVISFALSTFVLSVIYEAEIYDQNLEGSLTKLFKSNYLQTQLGQEFLEHCLSQADLDLKKLPPFFTDYVKQLKQLAHYEDKHLSAASAAEKKRIEKRLRHMEEYLGKILFASPTDSHFPYTRALQNWLKSHDLTSWQDKLKKRKFAYQAAKLYSVIASVFIGLSSVYLIGEVFSIIPFLAAIPLTALPFIIGPMAIISGLAYGLLTYNTITNWINHDTLNQWFKNLREEFKKSGPLRAALIGTMSFVLISLATVLTICTAGTWWTIATSSQPLFNWMQKMPKFIMGVCNPIVDGISTIFFNIENTVATMKELIQAIPNRFTPASDWGSNKLQSLKSWFSTLRAEENWLQILNPFRILLQITITPLRMLLFLGHLGSIALTTDRMPGIPQAAAASVAFVSEGFEDAHYFVGHHHAEVEKPSISTLVKAHFEDNDEHDHADDIPTRCLKIVTSPLYALAALWDYATSRVYGKQALSMQDAWDKQWGNEKEVAILPAELNKKERPSMSWRAAEAMLLIDKHIDEHLNSARMNPALAEQKAAQLTELKNKIEAHPAKCASLVAKESKKELYGQHRFFLSNRLESTTETQDLMARLKAS